MERGFTLVEIAIVVLVLGLLLASFLGPLSVHIEQQEIRKTSDQMEEIKEALYGYAMANGALPCPDTNGDGSLDVAVPATTPPSCDNVEGWLPFQTLGVAPGDAWGFRFRYRVTPRFTVADTIHDSCSPSDPQPSDLNLCANGDINVGTRRYDDRNLRDLATNVPAVILSHGKNGYGATRTDGSVIPTPGLWSTTIADEDENADDTNLTFINRHYTVEDLGCADNDESRPYCAFDDIVVWLSDNVLKYRLVQAGRLP